MRNDETEKVQARENDKLLLVTSRNRNRERHLPKGYGCGRGGNKMRTHNHLGGIKEIVVD